MFHPTALFIGLRYARARKGNGFVSFINFFSTAGITIGVMALILVVSVMNGFERELKSRILGIVPQVVVSHQNHLTSEQQKQASQKLIALPRVRGLVPFIESQALIQSESEMSGIQMIGIDPEKESGISPIAEAMLMGELGDLDKKKYQIIISQALSHRLGVTLGDQVRLSVLKGARYTPMGQVPNQRKFTVTGIFNMGSEADLAYAYVNIRDAARMIRTKPGYAEGMRLYLTDAFLADSVVAGLKSDPQWKDWTIHSWQKSHGELFAAVKMEKGMMWLLLMLIIAVAAFNIVSALFLIVANKQSDVAILQTLGLTPGQVTRIFMVQGCAQGLLGACLGALIGLLATHNLNSIIQFLGLTVVPTPGYSTQSLPVDIQYGQVAGVFVLAVCMSFLATLYPARQAAAVMPAEALRYE